MSYANLGVTPQMIAQLIIDDDANKPRSQQVAIGPSQIGSPCDRQLGYFALGTQQLQHTSGDPLPRWVGTEGHAGMERILTGHDDWDTEFEVDFPGYGITGHVDAYHKPTGTVVDFKFVGESQLRKYKVTGPGQQYRTQAHMYGTGIALTGRDVSAVAVAFIPRSGLTSSIYVWSEPYDETVTEAALRRWEAVGIVARGLGVDQLATADAPCDWCRWYRPGSTNPAEACPGVTDTPAAGFAAPNENAKEEAHA